MNEGQLLTDLNVFERMRKLPKIDGSKIDAYKRFKEQNKLQLWQRSISSWSTKSQCTANFKQTVNEMASAKVSVDKKHLDVWNGYNKSLRLAWTIFPCIFLGLLYFPGIFILLSGHCIGKASGRDKCGCKCFGLITFIACLGSAIVDTVT